MVCILDGISRDDIANAPFPYISKKGCLPPDAYQHLYNTAPQLRYDESSENNTLELLSIPEVIQSFGLDQAWHQFSATHLSPDFYRQLIALFRPHIDHYYPGLDQRVGSPLETLRAGLRNSATDFQVGLDCQFGFNTPVRTPSRVRAIHADKTIRLISGLLYMRHPDDRSTGGDLLIYKFKKTRQYNDIHGVSVDDGDAEHVATVPYEANRLILFLNTPDSLHGVSVRSVTPIARRYINFVVELKVPLFDVKRCIGTGHNAAVDQERMPA
ncbi:MAG: 2OG-Fe(II) oxygenase [Rhodospirillaceae bacterium]